MKTWVITLIFYFVLNLIIASIGYYLAKKNGQDPKRVFISVMLFSLMGFMFFFFSHNMKNKNNKKEDEDMYYEFTAPEVEGIVYYSKESKKYLIELNDTLVSLGNLKHVLKTNTVTFIHRDKSGNESDISVEEVLKLLNKKR